MLVWKKKGSESADIFEAFRRGDAHAFKHYFELFYRPLAHYAIKLAGDRDDAEEIIQEVFVKLYEKRAAMQDAHQISGLLFLATRNAVIDRFRKRKIAERRWKFEDPPAAEDYREALEIESIRAQWMAKIMETFSTLTQREQEIIRLHYFEEVPMRDIAERMGLRGQSALNLKQRALKRIRERVPRLLESF